MPFSEELWIHPGRVYSRTYSHAHRDNKRKAPQSLRSSGLWRRLWRWGESNPHHCAVQSTTSAAVAEGTGGTGGPGCGARGRWRGLAGLRDDAPSEARSADGSRAGRRPRAHQAARPNKAHATPGTPVGPQATPPKRKAYSPRNALIAGISRTACTRPAR